MKLQGMTNVEWRLIRRRRSGIASLNRFKIDRMHYSMFDAYSPPLVGWTFDVRCSSVSFSIRLDARGQRRCSYETTFLGTQTDRFQVQGSRFKGYIRWILFILLIKIRKTRNAPLGEPALWPRRRQDPLDMIGLGDFQPGTLMWSQKGAKSTKIKFLN